MLKSITSHVLVAAILLAGAAALSAARPLPPDEVKPETKPMTVKELIAVIKSDAPRKEKADACRELARVATPEAVPALAALLPNEELSHMARYALEPLPDPSVDAAFRDALGKLKGQPLVGVIGSIGVRRDAKAAGALTKFLGDSDPDVAQAAARALGKIGNSEAAKAVGDALAAVPAPNRVAFCEGLFRCAESLAAAGKRDEALAIYDRMRAMKEPHQVRAGGLRGAVLMRGKDGLPLLMEAIRGDDFVMVEAAARTAMEMPAADVVPPIAAELPKLTADKQVLFLMVLGKHRDASAMPAVLAAAKAGDKAVRIAAIRTTTMIGSPTAGPVLVQLMGDSETDVAKAAQTALAALPGAEVDTAIATMMNDQNPQKRALAIDLLGQRRTTSAMPSLLKAAEDSDEPVRTASIKVLSDMGGAAELPAMLGLLAKAKSPAEAQAVEGAISAICLRQTDRAACADKVLAALAPSQGQTKLSLLKVLAAVGGPKALDAVRKAAADPAADVKDAARRALCEWSTIDALPDVMELAKTSTDSKFKIIALRGYIRLASMADIPQEKRLASLKEAMSLATRKEEKRLVLAALGTIATADALALVAPSIDSADLKEEASVAAVAIAEKIVQSHPAEVADAMKQVVKATTNPKLAGKAKTLLGQAAPKKGGKK